MTNDRRRLDEDCQGIGRFEALPPAGAPRLPALGAYPNFQNVHPRGTERLFPHCDTLAETDILYQINSFRLEIDLFLSRYRVTIRRSR